jgi:hypothetical protein
MIVTRLLLVIAILHKTLNVFVLGVDGDVFHDLECITKPSDFHNTEIDAECDLVAFRKLDR